MAGIYESSHPYQPRCADKSIGISTNLLQIADPMPVPVYAYFPQKRWNASDTGHYMAHGNQYSSRIIRF